MLQLCVSENFIVQISNILYYYENKLPSILCDCESQVCEFTMKFLTNCKDFKIATSPFVSLQLV